MMLTTRIRALIWVSITLLAAVATALLLFTGLMWLPGLFISIIAAIGLINISLPSDMTVCAVHGVPLEIDHGPGGRCPICEPMA